MLEITPWRGVSLPRRPPVLAGFDLAGVGNDDLPLASGSRGTRVGQAQQALNILARSNGKWATITEDSVFGTRTTDAVNAFLQWKGLAATSQLSGVTFQTLINAAATVSILSGGSSTTSRPVLQMGSSGNLVRQLQQRLNELGWNAGETSSGIFGVNTKAAVERLQAAARIRVDGVVGVDTWAALDRGVRASSGGGSGSGTPTNPGSGSAQNAGAGGSDGFLVKALLGAGIGIGAAWLMAQKKL